MIDALLAWHDCLPFTFDNGVDTLVCAGATLGFIDATVDDEEATIAVMIMYQLLSIFIQSNCVYFNPSTMYRGHSTLFLKYRAVP